MDIETDSTARAAWFTTTHWSVVLTAGQNASPQAEAAMEKLCGTYWKPLYGYVRRRGYEPHDAQDLTQEFFCRFLEKNYLASVAPEKGKFRSFLLASLNHFLAKEREWANAAKRGGGRRLISLDDTAEQQYQLEPVSNLSPEREFEKRWAITLLEQAFARIREEFITAGKGKLFEQLKVFLADGTGSGDYAALASKMGMAPNTIAAAVHRLRQRYRELVRAEIAHTVAQPEEIEGEMRHLFSVLAR